MCGNEAIQLPISSPSLPDGDSNSDCPDHNLSNNDLDRSALGPGSRRGLLKNQISMIKRLFRYLKTISKNKNGQSLILQFFTH